MKINLSKIGTDSIQVLKKFPVEALTGLLFFVLYCIQDSLDYQNYSVWRGQIRDVMSLFPSIILIIYSLHQVCKGRSRIIYYLSVLIFIPFLWVDLDKFVFSISYSFTLLFALFVLLASKRLWDNASFAKNSIQTFVDLVVAFFTGHILTLAIWAILASVIYIFNIELRNYIDYIYIFSLFVVIPLLFCHLQERESEARLPRFMEIILNYILSPAVIIYTGILYLYFVVIAINWELPKGKIGYMVLAFILFSMIGRMSQLTLSKRLYDWFYDHFSWIAIPPLILFWIGTLERISAYSFTESRVYLLVSGVLMTLYISFFLFKRMRSYQLISLISALCIALLTYFPGINAKSIGIHAQERRLEKYITELDMWDAVTHKMKQGVTFSRNDSVSWQESREMMACYDYLSDEIGYKKVQEKYGYCDVVKSTQNRYMDIQTGNKNINIEGYTNLYLYKYDNTNKYNMTLNEGIIAIVRKKDNKTIISRDIDAYMNSHKQKMLDFAADSINTELFIIRNDSCMLILKTINYKGDINYSCTSATVDAILFK